MLDAQVPLAKDVLVALGGVELLRGDRRLGGGIVDALRRQQLLDRTVEPQRQVLSSSAAE